MRKTVFLLAALATALSIADYLAWRSSRRALGAVAEQAGLFGPLPKLELQFGRQTEPARAATLVAWGLLDLEVDRDWLDELPASERQAQAGRGIDRLRQARRLAEETLARRPAAWQAAMVLGATRYLEAERSGARRQPTAAWRRPLLTAMDLAPGHPEPPLFLASASLSRWSSLSAADRRESRAVLARAFEAPAGLELLLRPWARLASSMDELLEVIPDRPQAWQKLSRVFLATGDLERFSTVHQRWRDSLPAHLADRVAEARQRLRGGDSRRALDLARQVVAAPADLAFAVSFSDALALLPDHSGHERTRSDLNRWLFWALDLCVLGDCPLEAETLSRLAGHVQGLHPAQAGLAAMAAADPAGAAEFETAAGPAVEPEWHGYWVFKGYRLAAADPDSARQALDRAASTGSADPLYWRANERLAEVTGDRESLARAKRALGRLARDDWTTADWSFRGVSHRLALLTAQRYQSLRLDLAGMPPAGAAVELKWDGRALGVVALKPGEDLVWRLPVEPGIHQLEIANLSGPPLRPGTLSLEGALPPG